MNTAVRAFDLPLPSRIEAHAAGLMDSEIAPHGAMVYYTFPASNPARDSHDVV